MKIFNIITAVMLTVFTLNAPQAYASNSPSYEEAVQNIQTPKQLSKFLKKKFDFVLDRKQFDIEDYWQTPEEFWKNKKGDCEDYAVFSKAVLERMGFKAYTVSFYGSGGYAHTITVFEAEGGWNVMNEDRLYYYKAGTIEDAVTRVFPQWIWGGISRPQDTRGWLLREITNPALMRTA